MLKAYLYSFSLRVLPPRVRRKASSFIGAVAFLLGYLWLMTCVGSAVWLASQATITDADMATASWLISPSTTLFLHGTLGWSLSAVTLLCGVAVAIARKAPMAVVSALFVAMAIQIASDPKHIVRVGVLEGHIRIGCYLYELRECHDMLGLPLDSLPSRYECDSTMHCMDASWYRAKIRPANSNHLYSLPGVSFLSMPLHALRGRELSNKLAVQRAEVARYQAMVHQNASQLSLLKLNAQFGAHP